MKRRKISHLMAAAVASLVFHVILCLGFGEVKGFDFLSRTEQGFMMATLVEENARAHHEHSAAPAVFAAPLGVASTTIAPPEQGPDNLSTYEDLSSPPETPEDAEEASPETDGMHDEETPETDEIQGQEAEASDRLAVNDIHHNGIVMKTRPHDVPREERLEFDIRWQGLTLGNISLAHSKQGDESKISSHIHSSPTLSVFYNVDGDAVSIVRRGSPVSFRERHEAGKRRSDKETLFDPSQGRVVVFNHIKGTRAEFTSEDRLWDFVSGLYFIRAQDLDVGKTVSLHVFDSSKFFRVDMNVLRREEIEVGQATLRTLVIRPVITPYGDKAAKLFEKASDILIWLTDDTAKTPVRIEATTKIGRVVAALKHDEARATGTETSRTP